MTATVTPLRPAARPALVSEHPADRLPELTADHDHACQAASRPDTAAQMRADAQRTALRLGLSPDDPDVLARLLDYGRGQYVTGHMDASNEQRAIPEPGMATVLAFPGGA